LDSLEGKGSRFFVKLPVTLAEPIELAIDQIHTTKSKIQFDVLLVEDNEINRIVAREMLEADGHTVTEAHDGLEGVHKAQSKSFDLILMDISMPVMDGRTATRTIRSGKGSSADTKIVALTANAMEEEQENFKADGMNDILTKPLTKAALRNILNTIGKETEEESLGVVDDGHITEAREALGGDAYDKLLMRFILEVDELIGWLKSTNSQEWEEIITRTHKVAGSASVFGAIELRSHLKELEEAAKLNKDQEIQSLIGLLPKTWQSTKLALR
jgi:CheY-like chemotaxis protein